jgi:phosphoesterase RecJ-like protein
MANTSEKLVIDLIKRNKRILILPSSPIDGDSLGSAVALYLALKKLDKEVTVVCSEPVPELLQFLPNIKIVGNEISSSKDFIITLDSKSHGVENIKTYIEDDKVNIIITPKDGHFSERDINFNKGKVDYDLIITVDCPELEQLKTIYEKNLEIFNQLAIVNIDHHISNSHFGKVNHVDIMASSTAELLVPILEELGNEEKKNLIDADIATLLLAGIITDTGSFQNANTTPKSFAVSAQLVSYGARQQEIIQHVYKTKQLSQLKLWGRVLSKIQTDERYKIVWSTVSQQDFRDTGSSIEEIGDLIDELMTNAPGAEIVLLLKEKEDGSIGGSLRTTTPLINSSGIAAHFGGGGHTQAAGFSMKETNLRDAEYTLINYLKELQTKRLNLNDGINDEEFLSINTLMKNAANNGVEPKVVEPEAVVKIEQPVVEIEPVIEKEEQVDNNTDELNAEPDDSEKEEEIVEPTYKFED